MEALNDENRKWLSDLDERTWDRIRDSFGAIHQFENCKLDAAEIERLICIIGRHCLPCVLQSGPYGNLFMRIFCHANFPGMPPHPILTVGEGHVGFPVGFDAWNDRFDWFSRLTHSDSNRRILAFYELPKSESRERYEY